MDARDFERNRKRCNWTWLSCCLMLGAAAPCLAQSSLSEDLGGDQLNSAYVIPDPDLSVKHGRSLRAYPLTAYLPGTGLVAAGYLSHRGLLFSDDKLEMYGATTFGDQSAFMLDYSAENFLDTSMDFRAWASYVNFESGYFGRGNDTMRESKENYLPGRTEYGVALKRHLGRSVSLQAAFVSRSWNLTLDPETQVPLAEREGGMNRFVRLTLDRDTRDESLEPTRGGHDRLRVETSTPALGSDFEYSRLELRAARYRPISDRQTLALRAEYSTVLAGNAPFFELPRLGGSSKLRGESGGRFRANNSALLGLEWRLRVTEPLSFVAFTEAGRVWDTSEDLAETGLHVTGGIGARYRLSSSFLLRVDMALGSGGIKPIGNIGHAF